MILPPLSPVDNLCGREPSTSTSASQPAGVSLTV
jgi:hypothetical protein